ncbi:hypothetical protein Godav_002924, partial [Gossypium davidsonii]|nr:hypothetical protein [Gossypium davidsonii]
MAEEGKNWPKTMVWIEEAPQRADLVVERDRSFLIDFEM